MYKNPLYDVWLRMHQKEIARARSSLAPYFITITRNTMKPKTIQEAEEAIKTLQAYIDEQSKEQARLNYSNQKTEPNGNYINQ